MCQFELIVTEDVPSLYNVSKHQSWASTLIECSFQKVQRNVRILYKKTLEISIIEKYI